MNLTRKPYRTRGEKAMDFFIGFVGWFVVNGLLWGITQVLLVALGSLTSNLDYATVNAITTFGGLALACLPFLLNVAAVILFAFTRYWIALGILGAFAVTLLIIICIAILIGGICFAALYGYSNP